ncbi:plasminogen-like [Pecten maximus]|uniref:plasminogen-like n=1 Tax=Pecten maximus TaxID=6579 RepID=UPI0014587C26|nr:plasminogen-like [Pecten maximus]
MVIDNSEWRAVYATDIPEVLAGVCGNNNCPFSQKCVELTSGGSACVNQDIILAPGIYGDLLPNTRLYHPQGNTTITMYECTALTDQQPIESHPVARIVNGVYTRATVSCSAADCVIPSVSYEAYVTVTVSGTLCQRWDSNSPHDTKFFQGRSDLKNWCRLPNNETTKPWCYTTDPNIRWDLCPVIDCL